MREIKFRAIMKDRNATKEFTLQDLVNPNALFSIRELLIPWLLEGNQPDEWTGFKDKNGGEIYEGDILCMNPVDDEWYDVVIFENGKFELKSCISPEEEFRVADWCYGSSNPGLIVGNIHENPELLK